MKRSITGRVYVNTLRGHLSEDSINELLHQLERKPRRRIRSPFAGATIRGLRMLRALTKAAIVWRHCAVTGQYCLFPATSDVIPGAGLEQYHLMRRVEDHAWSVLRRRPDFPRIWEQHLEEHARVYNRSRYETMKLRQEVAELRSIVIDRAKGLVGT